MRDDDQEMSLDDRSVLAAEYVMGTLPAGERRAVSLALQNDEALLSDVHAWERHFGRLNASLAPEIPEPSLWSRIERSLPQVEGAPIAAAATPVAANDNALRRSRNRWRLGTLAAGIAAVLFGAVIAQDAPGGVTGIGQRVAGLFSGNDYPYGPGGPAGTPQNFVAVVNAEGGAQPALIVSVDATSGQVQVRSLGIERPEGKSLEVWHVAEDGKPVSVGLLGEGAIDLNDRAASGGNVIAISLEPQGGSPTGTATGPVVYSGKLVAAPVQ